MSRALLFQSLASPSMGWYTKISIPVHYYNSLLMDSRFTFAFFFIKFVTDH